jgi:hypothetical protein
MKTLIRKSDKLEIKLKHVYEVQQSGKSTSRKGRIKVIVVTIGKMLK